MSHDRHLLDATVTEIAELEHGTIRMWPGAYSAYATLAVGSALALFLYPHSVTAILSSNSGNTIRRNTALLPAYTFLLGLIALLGYMAIARGITPSNPNFAVPDLFLSVEFSTGEHMRTEISAKFREATVARELSTAGLRLAEWWTDDAGDFALSLALA